MATQMCSWFTLVDTYLQCVSFLMFRCMLVNVCQNTFVSEEFEVT